MVRSEHILLKIISHKFLFPFLHGILARHQRQPERKVTVRHPIALGCELRWLRFFHDIALPSSGFNLWLGLGHKEVSLGSQLNVLVGHVDFEGSWRCERFLLELASLQRLYELALDSLFDAL